MFLSKREYEDEMRRMMLRVRQNGNTDFTDLSPAEAEVLLDCIKMGYVIGEATKWDSDKHAMTDMRDIYGKATPCVISNIIPLKGMTFLERKADWKFIFPVLISIAALLVSIFKA